MVKGRQRRIGHVIGTTPRILSYSVSLAPVGIQRVGRSRPTWMRTMQEEAGDLCKIKYRKEMSSKTSPRPFVPYDVGGDDVTIVCTRCEHMEMTILNIHNFKYVQKTICTGTFLSPYVCTMSHNKMLPETMILKESFYLMF